MSKYYVHPTSIIDDNVSVGDNTKIWHFSPIQSGAAIGEDRSFGQNANISYNVKIAEGASSKTM